MAQRSSIHNKSISLWSHYCYRLWWCLQRQACLREHLRAREVQAAGTPPRRQDLLHGWEDHHLLSTGPHLLPFRPSGAVSLLGSCVVVVLLCRCCAVVSLLCCCVVVVLLCRCCAVVSLLCCCVVVVFVVVVMLVKKRVRRKWKKKRKKNYDDDVMMLITMMAGLLRGDLQLDVRRDAAGAEVKQGQSGPQVVQAAWTMADERC